MAASPDPTRLRSTGSAFIAIGVILLVIGFVVAGAKGSKHPDDSLAQMEDSQSPVMLLLILGGIAALTFGIVKKSAASRAEAEALRVALAPAEGQAVIVTPTVADTTTNPFAARAEAELVERRSRGTVYLVIGLVVMTCTVLGMIYAMSGGGATHGMEGAKAHFDHIFTSLGLAFFPFGISLFLVIKGGLMRSAK